MGLPSLKYCPSVNSGINFIKSVSDCTYWHFCSYLNAQFTINIEGWRSAASQLRVIRHILISQHHPILASDWSILGFGRVSGGINQSEVSESASHNNRFMNEKLSNELDEESRAVTACQSVITLIVNSNCHGVH